MAECFHHRVPDHSADVPDDAVEDLFLVDLEAFGGTAWRAGTVSFGSIVARQVTQEHVEVVQGQWDDGPADFAGDTVSFLHHEDQQEVYAEEARLNLV